MAAVDAHLIERQAERVDQIIGARVGGFVRGHQRNQVAIRIDR